ARSLVAATSSSRFTTPIFWADPNTGIGYQVQVEIPPYQVNSAEEIGLVPVKAAWSKALLLRDVARVHEQKVLGEYDRYNMRRLVSLTANIDGEDLGRVATHIANAIDTVNRSLWLAHEEKGKKGWKNAISGEFVERPTQPSDPPRAMQVDVRG